MGALLGVHGQVIHPVPRDLADFAPRLRREARRRLVKAGHNEQLGALPAAKRLHVVVLADERRHVEPHLLNNLWAASRSRGAAGVAAPQSFACSVVEQLGSARLARGARNLCFVLIDLGASQACVGRGEVRVPLEQ